MNALDPVARGLAVRAHAEAARQGLHAAGPAIAALGHSFVANMAFGSATARTITDRSHLYWATVLSGQRLSTDVALISGVNGDVVAGALARVQATLASDAGVVLLDIGTNDLAGTALSTMQDGYRALLDALSRAGRLVVAVPIVPRFASSWPGADAAAVRGCRAKAEAFNAWLFAQARVRRDLYVVDVLDLWTDQTLNYDLIPPGGQSANAGSYTFDGLHPSFLGAWILGTRIAEILGRIAPPAPRSRVALALWDAAVNARGNLLANPTVIGGGGFAGAGVSGTVANGWGAARGNGGELTATASIAASPLANGRSAFLQQVVAGNPGTTAQSVQLFQQIDIGGRYQAGAASLHGEIDIQVDAGAALCGVRILLAEKAGVGGSGAQLASAVAGGFSDFSATAPVLPGTAWSGRLRTPALASQTGAQSLTLAVDVLVAVGGSATVRLGNGSLTAD